MLDPPDYEMQQTEPPPPYVPERRSAAPWIIAAVLIMAAGAAVWFFFGARETQQAATPVAEATATPPPAAERPLCEMTSASTLPTPLPPLNDMDDMVDMLVGSLSSHPRVTAWLATDNLIRNFTVVVENIANGETPAPHLRTLRPPGPFRVINRRTDLLIDPSSYQRYTSFAVAVDSVDAQRAAQLCATLKPRIEEAYRELGREGSFDRALEQAIVEIGRAACRERV